MAAKTKKTRAGQKKPKYEKQIHAQEFVHVEDVFSGGYAGKDIKLRGWVYNSRSSGGIIFILLRDATGVMQCTVKKDSSDKGVFGKADSLTQESSIIVRGKVRKDERAPGGYELVVHELDVVHLAEEYPITKKEHGVKFLLDYRHLHLRSQKLTAVMRIKHTVLESAREWFRKHKWIEVTPPIILSQACEGGSTLFKFDYFGKEAALSQSAQLHLESLIFSLEKVYSITPSFRAEKSRTRRHVTEYWHIEAEAAWMHMPEILKVQEELVSYICQQVGKKHEKELKLLGRDPEYFKKLKPRFPRITYEEAIKRLKKKGFDVEWGIDFGAPEERALSQDFKTPFFITHFPMKIKAFYMKLAPAREQNHREKVVLGADLIAPEGYGEIIGGSERETNYKELIKRLKEQGEDIKNYEWYIDLRRYGSVPHSGFGLGAERIVRWICGLEHIRDATPFPRTPTRSYP